MVFNHSVNYRSNTILIVLLLALLCTCSFAQTYSIKCSVHSTPMSPEHYITCAPAKNTPASYWGNPELHQTPTGTCTSQKWQYNNYYQFCVNENDAEVDVVNCPGMVQQGEGYKITRPPTTCTLEGCSSTAAGPYTACSSNNQYVFTATACDAVSGTRYKLLFDDTDTSFSYKIWFTPTTDTTNPTTITTLTCLLADTADVSCSACNTAAANQCLTEFMHNGMQQLATVSNQAACNSLCPCTTRCQNTDLQNSQEADCNFTTFNDNTWKLPTTATTCGTDLTLTPTITKYLIGGVQVTSGALYNSVVTSVAAPTTKVVPAADYSCTSTCSQCDATGPITAVSFTQAPFTGSTTLLTKFNPSATACACTIQCAAKDASSPVWGTCTDVTNGPPAIPTTNEWTPLSTSTTCTNSLIATLTLERQFQCKFVSTQAIATCGTLPAASTQLTDVACTAPTAGSCTGECGSQPLTCTPGSFSFGSGASTQTFPLTSCSSLACACVPRCSKTGIDSANVDDYEECTSLPGQNGTFDAQWVQDTSTAITCPSGATTTTANIKRVGKCLFNTSPATIATDTSCNLPTLTMTGDVSCASTQCSTTQCATTQQCTATLTTATNRQTWSTTLQASDCTDASTTCACNTMCTPKDGGAKVKCSDIPISSTCGTATTFDSLYTIGCETAAGQSIACPNNEATIQGAKYTSSCNVFCVPPTETQYATPGTSVTSAVIAQQCDATYLRPASTQCSAWEPSTTERLLFCANSNGQTVTCPNGTVDGPQSADASCVTLCTSKDTASLIIGDTQQLSSSLEVCTADSFREKWCSDDTRKTYCALKSGNTYTISKVGDCSLDTTFNIIAAQGTCSVGCFSPTFPDTTTANQAIAVNKFQPNCQPNHYRYLATNACPPINTPTDSVTVRSVFCVLKKFDDIYEQASESECDQTAFETAENQTWDQSTCGLWCMKESITTPEPGTKIVTSEDYEVCTVDSFKPTTSTTCGPIESNTVRKVLTTYTDGTDVIVALSTNTAFTNQFTTTTWDGQCEFTLLATTTPGSSTFTDYAATTINGNTNVALKDLCSTVCEATYTIPTANTKCLRTKNWSGAVETGYYEAGAGETCTATTLTYPCPCAATPFCLETGQTASDTPPTLCTVDQSWSTVTTCGPLQTRQTFIKTSADTFLTPTTCTSCTGITFAPTTQAPTNLSTLCATNWYCKGGETTDVIGQCTGDDGNYGFAVCDDATCNNVNRTRTVSCLIGGTKTITELETEIASYDDAIKTQFTTVAQCTGDEPLSTRECKCIEKPYCKRTSKVTTDAGELTFNDVINCNDTTDPDGPTPCTAVSCTATARSNVVCHEADGTFRDYTTGECGTTTTPPTCPASHICLGTDFCADIGTIPTLTSDICTTQEPYDKTKCYTFNPTGSVFTSTTCTDDVSQTYYYQRTTACLTYYVDESDVKLPLPEGILNTENLCPTSSPVSNKLAGCTDYTTCTPIIQGPLQIIPKDDTTTLTGQFHENGPAEVSWSYRGPPTATQTVTIQYAIATSASMIADSLQWQPLHSGVLLTAAKANVQLPSISGTNKDIYIRAFITSGTYVYTQAHITILPFATCDTLQCPTVPGSYFKCVAPSLNGRTQPATCSCDPIVPDWVKNGACNQTATCQALSTTGCKNDGFYLYDATSTTKCTSECICPGGQGGSTCDGQCPENSCITTNGKISTSTTSCYCSSCYAGFGGKSCNHCTRYVSIALSEPSDSIKSIFSKPAEKEALMISLQKFLATELDISVEFILIDLVHSKVTTTAVTIVYQLAGSCNSSSFEMLQTTPSINTVSTSWNNLSTETLAESDDLKSATNGDITTSMSKSEAVDPQTCLKSNTCPDYTGLTCDTQPENPACQKATTTKSNSTTIIVAIVVPVGVILLVALIVVLVLCVGCGKSSEGGSGSGNSTIDDDSGKKSKKSKGHETDHLELV